MEDQGHPGVAAPLRNYKLPCGCGHVLATVTGARRPVDFPKLTCPRCDAEYTVEDGSERLLRRGRDTHAGG